jgi:NADH dehydrogenase FAD-containing subunit
MAIPDLKRWLNKIFRRADSNLHQAAMRAGIPYDTARSALIPRKDSEVAQERAEVIRRIADQLPADEQSNLLRVAVAGQAGALGVEVVNRMEVKLAELARDKIHLERDNARLAEENRRLRSRIDELMQTHRTPTTIIRKRP